MLVTFLYEFCFTSKILSSSCSWHQNLKYECFGCPGNEVQSSDFDCFLAIFYMSQTTHFGTSLNTRTFFLFKQDKYTMDPGRQIYLSNIKKNFAKKILEIFLGKKI